MIAFINEHRAIHGVEPICRVLPIAPSTYHAHAARRADPGKLSARAQRDATLRIEIRRVYEENFRVYGVRKVWRQLGREGIAVARCTVARLMRTMGLQGVVRGKTVRTTISKAAVPCPLDRVNRQFTAPRPDALWVSDFTDVATWAGFIYVAFVIDAFARRIPRVGLRPPEDRLWLACLSDGARRLCAGRAGAGPTRAPARPRRRPRPPQRSRCAVRLDQIDRAACQGGHRALGRQRRRQRRQGSRRDHQRPLQSRGDPSPRLLGSFEAVAFATLEWVDWFNNRRLPEPIGNRPPAEAEAAYYAQLELTCIAA